MKIEIKERIEKIKNKEIPEGYRKTNIGIQPKEWERSSAKEIFENISDKSHGGTLEVLSVTQDRGVISRSEVGIDIKFDSKNLNSYKKVNIGDFIISLRSFQGGFELSYCEGIVSPAYTVFKLKDKENFNSEYYKYFFKSKNFINRLNTLTYGIRDGKAISFTDFSDMKLSVPTLEEQNKAVRILSKWDEGILKQEKLIEAKKKHKKGMMQKIFSQELRFKDENGNDYPEWEEKSLENITDYVDYRGKTPTKTESGIFLVTAKNIKMGYIDYETSKEFIGQESYDEAMRKGFPKIGDVLFTTEAPMGNVAQVDNENIALAQRVIKFRGKSILNNTFLKYSFINDKFQNELLNNAIGTTVLGIQGKVLHKMKINFPSLTEQEKIADFLSIIDREIELLEKELSILKSEKQSLMSMLLNGIVRTV